MRYDPNLQLWQLDRECEAMDPERFHRRRLARIRAAEARAARRMFWRDLMAWIKGRRSARAGGARQPAQGR